MDYCTNLLYFMGHTRTSELLLKVTAIGISLSFNCSIKSDCEVWLSNIKYPVIQVLFYLYQQFLFFRASVVRVPGNTAGYLYQLGGHLLIS